MRGQRARVHTFSQYDVNVDTSIAAPRECPEAILAVLDAQPASRLPLPPRCQRDMPALPTPSPAASWSSRPRWICERIGAGRAGCSMIGARNVLIRSYGTRDITGLRRAAGPLGGPARHALAD